MLDILTLRPPPSVALSSTCQEFELKNECLGEVLSRMFPLLVKSPPRHIWARRQILPPRRSITFRSSGCATLEVEGAHEE
jgi:hypothetical protein